MIRIHNTMGRQLVDFVPREEGRVGMYVCGPTVQSEPHVGHGRYAVAFDVIRRYLQWRGFEVTYVSNITDVEDKIIAAAAETGESVEDLAVRMTERFSTSFKRLGVLPPDVEPKATEHIPEMLDLISRLIDRGLAYSRHGDVYFSVPTLESYGRLSGRRPDELRAGHRIEVDEAKEDPLDFALWKAAKPGEPTWDSPWGPGRPGWHIECSAMASKYLGEGFDIHGGGLDLVFPHHENEVAQSEGASGETFARYWLHNGMVNLGGEKMAKSTGNVVDLQSILDNHGGRALRLLYVRAHYRSPIDYSEELLAEAEESLDRLDRFLERAATGEPDVDAVARFTEVMDDDFGTSQAVSLMFDLIREGNRLLDDEGDASALAGSVESIVGVLGLDDAEPAPVSADGLSDGEIDELVAKRHQARADRDFAQADRIRDELASAGVSIEDGPHGTRWIRR
ncbi:MAG TPA: cysteine--tRNA ligase [Acidimicrobiia bacterium]|nr:cysteine--tRNA ligase [Acidimicrobiia bacterium]